MRLLMIVGALLALTSPVGARAGDYSANLPVIDLSDLVVDLLPADGFKTMDWDYLVDDPRVEWTTDGTRNSGSRTIREGVARVTAAGKLSQILRRKWEELPWTVTLATFSNPKHGPQMITIKPGNDADQHFVCFGTLFRGCDFPEIAALSSLNLQYQQVCIFGAADNFKQAFSVSAPGKKSSLLVYETAGGSGGSSSWLEIRPLSAQAEVCKP